MKKCPWCAEEIQDEAVVCRFCQRDLRVTPAQAPSPAPPKKSSYGCLLAVVFTVLLCLPLLLLASCPFTRKATTPAPSTTPATTPAPAAGAPVAAGTPMVPFGTRSHAEQLADARASIDTFAKATDFSTVAQVLATAQGVSELLAAVNRSSNPELTAQQAAARKALAAAQVTQFPKLRRAWVRGVNGALWERNLSAACVTKSCDVVQFVGGLLASNARKKEMLETFEADLRQLRVRQVRMKWFEGADEYTSWTLVVPKDHELTR